MRREESGKAMLPGQAADVVFGAKAGREKRHQPVAIKDRRVRDQALMRQALGPRRQLRGAGLAQELPHHQVATAGRNEQQGRPILRHLVLVVFYSVALALLVAFSLVVAALSG